MAITNLSVLSTQTNSLSALSNLAVVVPQVAGIFGLSSGPEFTVGYQPQTANSPLGQIDASQKPLLFHYEGENRIIIESDITDHYVEDNTAVQDQIALKPEKVTVHGFIGELNDVPPAILQTLAAAATTLTPISAYAPSLSTTALLAYDNAFQLYQAGYKAVNASVSALSSLVGGGGTTVINGTTFDRLSSQNKQQTMFQQLYGYYLKRVLFTVQTPWAVFQNMAIERFTVTQEAETSVISDFEVTFKLIRVATTQFNIPITSGRFTSQSFTGQTLGTITPPFSSGIGNFPGLGVS